MRILLQIRTVVGYGILQGKGKLNSIGTNEKEISMESVVESDKLKTAQKENSDNAETNEEETRGKSVIEELQVMGMEKLCRLKWKRKDARKKFQAIQKQIKNNK